MLPNLGLITHVTTLEVQCGTEDISLASSRWSEPRRLKRRAIRMRQADWASSIRGGVRVD